MKRLIPLGVLWLLVAGQVFSEIPAELYYENFYETDGEIDLVIRVYTNATSGEYLYEDSNQVAVVNGAFSTRIGDNTLSGTLTNALSTGSAYLDVTINGVNYPPREQILPESYALRANSVANNAILATMIADGAVQSRHITDAAVTTAQLAASSVTSAKLAPDVQTANDSRYVNASGDTMSGSLTLQGNVVIGAVACGYTRALTFRDYNWGTYTNQWHLFVGDGDALHMRKNGSPWFGGGTDGKRLMMETDDSSTNYVRRTGDAITGSLTNIGNYYSSTGGFVIVNAEYPRTITPAASGPGIFQAISHMGAGGGEITASASGIGAMQVGRIRQPGASASQRMILTGDASIQRGAFLTAGGDSSSATNTGTASVGLFSFGGNQHQFISGNASIGLGAVAVTNNNALVAGDGNVSHGDGSVTASRFYGDGSGLSNLNILGDTNYVRKTGDTMTGTLTVPAVNAQTVLGAQGIAIGAVACGMSRALVFNNAGIGSYTDKLYIVTDYSGNLWARKNGANYFQSESAANRLVKYPELATLVSRTGDTMTGALTNTTRFVVADLADNGTGRMKAYCSTGGPAVYGYFSGTNSNGNSIGVCAGGDNGATALYVTGGVGSPRAPAAVIYNAALPAYATAIVARASSSGNGCALDAQGFIRTKLVRPQTSNTYTIGSTEFPYQSVVLGPASKAITADTSRVFFGGNALMTEAAAGAGYVAKSGDTMTGTLTLQTNLVVNGYATVLRVVKQGDISMGSFTNGP